MPQSMAHITQKQGFKIHFFKRRAYIKIRQLQNYMSDFEGCYKKGNW